MENSQTTSRPPGLVTRRISMQGGDGVGDVAQTEGDGHGVEAVVGVRQLEPVAGHEGQPRAAALADRQHAERDVGGHDEGTGRRERLARGAGPRRQVQHPVARPAGRPPPARASARRGPGRGTSTSLARSYRSATRSNMAATSARPLARLAREPLVDEPASIAVTTTTGADRSAGSGYGSRPQPATTQSSTPAIGSVVGCGDPPAGSTVTASCWASSSGSVHHPLGDVAAAVDQRVRGDLANRSSTAGRPCRRPGAGCRHPGTAPGRAPWRRRTRRVRRSRSSRTPGRPVRSAAR